VKHRHRRLERFLESGDVVELEVEGIGMLSNRLVRTDPGTAS